MSGPRVYFATGELSGDRHAAAVASAFRRLVSSASIEATGGPALAAAGAAIRHPISGLGAFGAAEIVGTIPRHVAVWQDLRRRFREGAIDLLVAVDYPGFHLRLADAAARSGVPVLYYIAPQLWAWGAHRAARLRRHIRQLAVILPFEEPFFHGFDIPTTFVGHPLLDRSFPDRPSARAALELPDATSVLSLFPGSRPGEVRRLWPAFRDAAFQVQSALPETRVLVATVPGASYPGGEAFTLCGGDAGPVLAAGDAALCKSGTTTLEAALCGLPMVVAYRLHPWSFAIARRVVRVPHVSLVNLIAGRKVVPELLQGNATPEALARAVLPLLDRDSRAVREQRAAFAEIRARLGTPGAADRVAEMAAGLVA